MSGCGIIWIGFFSAEPFLLAENAAATAAADEAAAEEKEEKEEERHHHKAWKRTQTKRVTEEI